MQPNIITITDIEGTIHNIDINYIMDLQLRSTDKAFILLDSNRVDNNLIQITRESYDDIKKIITESNKTPNRSSGAHSIFVPRLNKIKEWR